MAVDGVPSGITVDIKISGVWQPIGTGWAGIGATPYLARFSVNRQGSGMNRSSSFSVTIHQKGGGADIHDWQDIRAIDTAAAPYYYGGLTMIQRTYTNAASEKVWDLTCVSYHQILTKGSKTITNRIHIPAGQTDALILGGGTWSISNWAASTDYSQSQTAKSTVSPVNYFECAGPGAHTFSTSRIYKLGKGVLPTDPTIVAWFELTTAGGAATAEPNWSSAPAVGNTVSLGGNTWTNRSLTPSTPRTGLIEPGQSGADPWPTVVGDTIPWGNVTWRCMGTLAWGGIMPTYAPELTSLGISTVTASCPAFDWQDMTVADVLDALKAVAVAANYPNYSVWVNASGAPAFTWFDLNNPSHVPTTTALLTDNPVAGTDIAYTKFERNINGQTATNWVNVAGDPQSGAAWYVDGSAVGRTFTANAGTDFITLAGHGFNNGDRVYFQAPVLLDGTVTVLPSPLIENAATSPSVDYYVRNKTVNTFQLSATPSGAIIDLTTAGSGGPYCSNSSHFDYYAQVSYNYYGRVITVKTQTDTTLTTNAQCLAKARAYIKAYYNARDTIQTEFVNKGIDGLGLAIPRKIPVTNAMEGLSATTYANVRDNLGVEGSTGIFTRSLDLGDAWEDNQERGKIPGLGSGFVGDRVPPAPPTWLALVDAVLENTLDSMAGSVLLHVQHHPNSEGDLNQYQYRVTNNVTGRVVALEFRLQPTVDIVFRNLYPNNSHTVEVRAMDTSGNWSNTYNSAWPSITVTTATNTYDFLFNADFEQPDRYDRTLPWHWARTVANGGFARRDTTVSYSGIASCNLGTTGAGGSTATITSALTTVQGAVYALTFWAEVSSGTTNLTWKYDWYNSQQVFISSSSGTVGLTSSFQRFIVSGIPSAAAAYYRLSFTLSTLSKTVYLDAVTSVTAIPGVDDFATASTAAFLYTTPAGCTVSFSNTDADVHTGGAALVFDFT